MKLKFIYITVFILWAGCSSAPDQPAGDTQPAEQTSSSSLEFTEDEFRSGELSVVTVELYDFGDVIRANGYIDVPPEGRAAVSAFYGGYVKQINLIPGQSVKKGDVLMTLENPEYLEMQQQYLSVLKRMDYLKDDYERQKTLLAENISSKKSFLKAEADYNTATAELEGLKEKLLLLGINLKQVEQGKFSPVISLRSPLNGHISEVQAVKGHYLPPAEAAVTILNTDHMHLEIQVYEKDLPRIRVGQQIRMRLPSAEDKEVYMAEVYLVGKNISGENRVAMVHAHLLDESVEKTLTIGMYIEADIIISSDPRPALPSSAIQYEGGQAFVWVRKNNSWPASFERQNIETGASADTFTEITGPLPENSRVLNGL